MSRQVKPRGARLDLSLGLSRGRVERAVADLDLLLGHAHGKATDALAADGRGSHAPLPFRAWARLRRRRRRCRGGRASDTARAGHGAGAVAAPALAQHALQVADALLQGLVLLQRDLELLAVVHGFLVARGARHEAGGEGLVVALAVLAAETTGQVDRGPPRRTVEVVGAGDGIHCGRGGDQTTVGGRAVLARYRDRSRVRADGERRRSRDNA